MNYLNDNRLFGAAIRMVPPVEARQLLGLLKVIAQPASAGAGEPDIHAQVKSGDHSTAFNSLALYASRMERDLLRAPSAVERAQIVRALLNLQERLECRLSSEGDQDEAHPVGEASAGVHQDPLAEAIVRTYQINVGRMPAAEEIEIWRNNFRSGLAFHEFVLGMASSPEAEQHRRSQAILGGISDAECAQRAYEIVLGRGAAAWEVEHWRDRLESGSTTRAEMLAVLFETSNRFANDQADAVPHDGLSCLVLGTGRHLTAEQWRSQAQAAAETPLPPASHAKDYQHRFHVRGEPRVQVSALASLYRGGDFIEQFMDNITSQDEFDDRCELVIVDADSPENEYETIRRYEGRHRNIRYVRCNYRIGIYDAWNVAAKAARGEYLTNTNMDDLRRHDSFLLQAGVLDNLPFVDVVYQDLYYTFDPRLSFDAIAAFGHKTNLPVITPHNMMRFNSPHNAPMWRRRLHDEVGYFDTRYKSAGDYEFWMRCLAAGKRFYKTNDPHVVYYQNPKGLSTRPDTRGVVEAMDVNKAYCRKLLTEDVTMPTDEFVRKLNAPAAETCVRDDRDRFRLVQHALRAAARSRKYVPRAGENA